MAVYRFKLVPRSTFATPLRGDTLFGHLCWAIRNRWGEQRLVALLAAYCHGKPFAVLSDPFPESVLPRPKLPRTYSTMAVDAAGRKLDKLRNWFALAQAHEPVKGWRYEERPLAALTHRSHNSIDRLTGTTGSGDDGFAPFVATHLRYAGPLDLYAVIPGGVSFGADELGLALADVGTLGYGADSSTGAGRFDVGVAQPTPIASSARANAWLGLAPFAPQGGGVWDIERCWYAPLVRFGKHGDAAGLSGTPWKSPILLADTGAVLTPQSWRAAEFIGQGLGGGGQISRTAGFEATVHQGYAPVLPIEIAMQVNS